jgi:glycosidase
MQWTAGGGFSSSIPWNTYYDDVAERNVAAQDEDPDSLLNHYRTLIRLRNEHEALRIGDWRPVESGNLAVHAFLRSTENENILALLNLSGKPVSATDYSLSLADGPLSLSMQPTLLLGHEAAVLAAPTLNANGGFDAYQPLELLPPNSSFLIQLLH